MLFIEPFHCVFKEFFYFLALSRLSVREIFIYRSYLGCTRIAMVAEGSCFIVIGKDEKMILWQNL